MIMLTGSTQIASAPVKPREARHEREALLAAAALYRMLAQAFSAPQPSMLLALRSAAHDLSEAAGWGLLPRMLQPALRALLRAWRIASVDELAAEYSRLFLGSGLVALREGGYGGGSRFAGQPVDIADLNGFYLAFGFELSHEAPCPPDHLGTELEFVSLLMLKKSLAVQKGTQREVRVVDRAITLFLKDHLGRWTDAVESALRDAGAAPAYALVAELMRRSVAAQCTSLRIRPEAAMRNTTRDSMLEDALECPFAGGEAGNLGRGRDG